jgi:hypothetical protein
VGSGFCVCYVYESKFVVDLYRAEYPFTYVKSIEVPLV